jgi:PAS domain S-box-containing protein
MIVDINDAFSLISGYSREEAINDLTVRLNLWADPEDRKRVIGSLMEGNKITGEEYQFRRKSGEVMYGVFSAQITHINNEHYILSSINDITDRKVAEEKLRQREAALNYSQEIAKMWSWELNPHTSKVSWSMNYYLLLGQKPDDNELSYESFEKMVHPDDKHLLDETLTGIYQTRNPANVDLRLMMPDGQVKWIQNNVVPTFDGDTLIDLKGVSIDITEKKLNENEIRNLNASLELKIKAGTLKLSETNENLQKEIENRKRVEADLEESLEKYRGLSEASFEAIFISETGVCIEQNLAAEKMFGYTSEEALTRYGTDWIVPEERKMVMNNMLAGNENPFEATALRKDGTTFPCVLHGRMMHYKGKNVRVTSLTDITERKKAEIALHNSQEQLELVIKGSNDAPWDWNLVENNLFYSSKWWQQIGYAPEEIPSDSTLWRNLTHPDDIDRINLIFETALKSGNDSYDAEFRLLHKNGYYVPVLSRGFITRDANRKPVRVTGTNMDLTERYHAEKEIIKSRDEAQKANLAKSEFLSRMSHELRTPLNSVLGFAQLMAMGELNPKQNKRVNHILTNGKHLLGLINEVLDISHIESGRLSLLYESVQLSQIISETLDTVQPFADARQITMSLDNSPHNQLFVISDRKRLKQALINLLTNAVKYNRHGGTISVKSEPGPPIEEGRVSVRISVTDTGLGIHPDDIPKLFTPFERIGAEKTQTEGTGLGLAVVKKIMDAMKGTVGVETVVDKGSTFWLELPGAEEHMGQDRQKEDHESRITGQDVAGKRQSRLLF